MKDNDAGRIVYVDRGKYNYFHTGDVMRCRVVEDADGRALVQRIKPPHWVFSVKVDNMIEEEDL